MNSMGTRPCCRRCCCRFCFCCCCSRWWCCCWCRCCCYYSRCYGWSSGCQWHRLLLSQFQSLFVSSVVCLFAFCLFTCFFLFLYCSFLVVPSLLVCTDCFLAECFQMRLEDMIAGVPLAATESCQRGGWAQLMRIFSLVSGGFWKESECPFSNWWDGSVVRIWYSIALAQTHFKQGCLWRASLSESTSCELHIEASAQGQPSDFPHGASFQLETCRFHEILSGRWSRKP